MKLVHVVSTLDPAGGGPPQVAVRLAAAQAARGHDVHLVFHATTADKPRVAQQLERVPHQDRLHLHPVTDPSRLERLSGARAGRLLERLVRSADFVHIHGVWGALLRRAARVSQKLGVPYCFRPAGMLDPWSLAQKRWKKQLALWFGYRAALDAASFIHVLNEDEQKLMAPLALRAEAVVIPNGVFLEEVEPLPSLGSFRSTHPELGAAPFILFLSRLHHKKGLDILARAFALLAGRHAEVKLVVAGPDEGARQDFVGRIAASGLTGRTQLVGPLYGQDKFAAMVDASCFCLPSRQEGFSVAITEAMACGLPVVISEACHFPEVSAAGAGLVTTLDAEAVANALARLFDEPAGAARMGAAGALLVRQRYTWGAIAEQTLAIYERKRATFR
ncbi:MAG TPA: glycosyltransferase [Polyangia bacterium]|jgi:glycosyltransferase involved in cell wall biosynthesis